MDGIAVLIMITIFYFVMRVAGTKSVASKSTFALCVFVIFNYVFIDSWGKGGAWGLAGWLFGALILFPLCVCLAYGSWFNN
tara:strand:- start:182 stop:424 length:243 start_codon:yes stop_codon:yes gene_type:complete